MWQISRPPCESCEPLLETESQSDRVTESQSHRHSRVPSIRVGEFFFVPDFNKLPYSLRSQGDDRELDWDILI